MANPGAKRAKSGKKGRHDEQEIAPMRVAGTLKALAWIIGTTIAVLGLLVTYKYTGAEEQRNEIYRPLYSELQKVAVALQQGSFVIEVPATTKSALEQSGDLNRIPKTVRDQILLTYKDALAVQGDLSSVELVQRLISERIKQIRTPEVEAKWIKATVASLNWEIQAKPGVSAIRSFTMNHVGHSPVLDVHDPTNPHIARPGDIVWDLPDWLGFPDSARQLEQFWDDKQLLIFDRHADEWYYRITRDDLRRNQTDLATFLAPVSEELRKHADLTLLAKRRDEARQEVLALTRIIAERINDPKRISDILQ